MRTCAFCMALGLAIGSAAAEPGPVGPGRSVAPNVPTMAQLSYHLMCKAAMPPGHVIYRVAVKNEGPGNVTPGTRIHWVLAIQPGGTFQGDYTFGAPLAPGAHVWVPSAGLPLTWKTDTCTVTLLK